MGRPDQAFLVLLFLIIISNLSYGLIDPPVDEVHQHNLQIADTISEVYDTNVLNCTILEPDIDNPLKFFCVRILTLTPSVNESVTSSKHPQLVWAIAADNERSFQETWESDEGCPDSWRRRTYGDIQIKSAKAYYSVDGLLKMDGNETTFQVAREDVDLLFFDNSTNTTEILNPTDVPFNETDILCEVISSFSEFLFGSLFDFDCYAKNLDRASPYAVGVYNLTVRNQTIVNPHLNVTIVAQIEIPYVQTGKEYYDEDDSCEHQDLDENDSVDPSANDFRSYEVQNEYMTIISHSPGFLSLEANTSENVRYHFTLLSNSNLYKYYSRIDNQTAGAFYYYNFTVENESLGIQEIFAHGSGAIGLLPDDPQSKDVYNGTYRFLFNMSMRQLRNPYEAVNGNFSYNFSKLYEFMDEYENVTDGNHTVSLDLFTWFGNYTADSHIHVRSSTVLSVDAISQGNDSVLVLAQLQSKGLPVSGEQINLTVDSRTKTAITGSDGFCQAVFSVNSSFGNVKAAFGGSDQLIPAKDQGTYSVANPFNYGMDILPNNLGLLILLSFLFAFSMMNLLNFLTIDPIRGGIAVGFIANKFYPYKPRIGKAIAAGINSYTKQAADVAVAVGKAAVAVATGGASLAAEAGTAAAAGAAEKAAVEGATKKAVSEGSKGKMLAKKGIKETAVKKTSNMAGKKEGKNLDKKDIGKTKKKIQKRESGAAGPGKPDDWEVKLKEIKNKYLKPHLKSIYQKAKTACENIGKPELMKNFWEKETTMFDDATQTEVTFKVRLGKVEYHFEENIRPSAAAETCVEYYNKFKINVFDRIAFFREEGIEARFDVFLRPSRIDDLSKMLPDCYHEDYHTLSKLDEGKYLSQIEGAHEVMSFEDSMKKINAIEKEELSRIINSNQSQDKISDKIDILKKEFEQVKNDICIESIEYREYARPQYYLKKMIGDDNYHAGHLAGGYEHLKQTFDESVGVKGEYDRIFGAKKDSVSGNWTESMGDTQKALELEKHIDMKFSSEEAKSIKDNGLKILLRGRFDV